jgi:hypothetical protein
MTMNKATHEALDQSLGTIEGTAQRFYGILADLDRDESQIWRDKLVAVLEDAQSYGVKADQPEAEGAAT